MKARDNPFASHRLERLAFRFPAGDSAAALLDRLETNAWRGAIVGPHGSGKTSLLEQLAPLLAERGFQVRVHRLYTESTSPDKAAVVSGIQAGEFLLLDGAEQLTTRQWLGVHNAARQAAGCLITVHRTSRLPTVLETAPSPALLNDLVYELTEAWLPEGEPELIFRRHHGNIRECFRELYDRWAG